MVAATFQPLRRDSKCPVCQSDDGRCRATADLILCMKLDQDVPGYRFIKMSNGGSGPWAIYAPDTDDWSEERREEHRRQMEAARQRQHELEKWRNAQALPVRIRHQHYSALLQQTSLEDRHWAELQSRGLSDQQAVLDWGFRSVHDYHRLDPELPDTLSGVRMGGKQLQTMAGLLCPIRDPKGRLTGFQVRVDDADGGGRYRWLSSKSKANPDGPQPHLKNGENPITVCKGQEEPGVANLCEGILKPYVASQRWQQTFLGAAGGLFPSSSSLLKLYLERLRVKQVRLWADGGATFNSGVLSSYRQVLELCQAWGYEVRLVWWGQVEKADGDCDEIDPSTPLKFLEPRQYWSLVREHNLPVLGDWAYRLGIKPDTTGHPTELPRRAEGYKARVKQSRMRRRIVSLIQELDLDWEADVVSGYLQSVGASTTMMLNFNQLAELSDRLEHLLQRG